MVFRSTNTFYARRTVLRVLLSGMKIELALYGADAAGAVFTAHLGMLYALRKSF